MLTMVMLAASCELFGLDETAGQSTDAVSPV